MPYKHPERKKEWERIHRAERLARRRELRQIGSRPIDAPQVEPQRNAPKVEVAGLAVLFPVIAGVYLRGPDACFCRCLQKESGLVGGGVRHSFGGIVFLLARSPDFGDCISENNVGKLGRVCGTPLSALFEGSSTSF